MTGFPQKIYGIAGFQIPVRPPLIGDYGWLWMIMGDYGWLWVIMAVSAD